jgi:hypothetical protein
MKYIFFLSISSQFILPDQREFGSGIITEKYYIRRKSAQILRTILIRQ